MDIGYPVVDDEVVDTLRIHTWCSQLCNIAYEKQISLLFLLISTLVPTKKEDILKHWSKHVRVLREDVAFIVSRIALTTDDVYTTKLITAGLSLM